MKNDDSLLNRVEIAKPCSANWDDMTGDDRVRACQLCHLNVYNISTMSKNEAESFLRERLPQGRVCVRLYKRADGTIINDNCPRGLRAARDAAKMIKQRVAAAASLVLTFLAAPSQAQNNGSDSPKPLQGETTVKPCAPKGNISVPLMGAPAPITAVQGGMIAPAFSDLDRYMMRMQTKIATVWNLPAGSNKTIKVLFKIKNDGSISNLKIDKSSGNSELDKKALAAVQKAAPFEKLPPHSQAKVDANFTFR